MSSSRNDGYWYFMAGIHGNFLNPQQPPSIALMYPAPPDLSEENYQTVRTFSEPFVAVMFSDMVQQAPGFNIQALLAGAINAATEMIGEGWQPGEVDGDEH